MKDALEGLSSYLLAAFMIAFAFTVDHASVIMKLGGILLLGIRLYSDGKRAYKTWKGEL